ncbi:hypothetical protein GX48_00024 [Paracoccidioides brasiliensis]|nr:hypothetical protein GX48_00024 [Paracoccidioides brasiliensis]
MPPIPSSSSLSPRILVARFLRSNNYSQTLAAFIEEAGLPAEAGSLVSESENENWTIEKIMEEKRVFDKTLELERFGSADAALEERWRSPAPSIPIPIETPSEANILSVSVQPCIKISEDGHPEVSSGIIYTGADRRLSLIDIGPCYHVALTYENVADSPILSCVSLYDGAYRAMTTMSGLLILFQGPRPKILDSRKDHTKYAVSVVSFQEEPPEVQTTWLATAGWDSRVYIYRITAPDIGAQPSIGEPLAVIKTATIPECILFIRNRDTGDLVLLASRRDSTNLYYYLVESPLTRLEKRDSSHSKLYECPLLGKQNLAPHSNAWIAFSPACFAISPRDPGLLAVATSSQPHMKLIMVRLLIPSTASEAVRARAETQASQALAELTIQNREDSAIVVQVNTMAPQTAYSIPQVVWRPDGSGVWVNGDDGMIRGIEAKTGRLITKLEGGHESGSKVRSLWAGWVSEHEGEAGVGELVLSGGFDKRLIVWKVGS